MSRIQRHPRAAEDLLDLWSYIAQDAPDGIALVRVLSRYVDLDEAEFEA